MSQLRKGEDDFHGLFYLSVYASLSRHLNNVCSKICIRSMFHPCQLIFENNKAKNNMGIIGNDMRITKE